MFNSKPAYTTDDLNAAVKRLSDLERLADTVEQKIRLYANSKPDAITELIERHKRYQMDIKSAQLRLDYMQREGIR